MTAFHLYCDAVVNLHKKKSNITLQNNKTQDIHEPITSLCILSSHMRTGVMTSGAPLSETSSRFVFHVGKVLLWKV